MAFNIFFNAIPVTSLNAFRFFTNPAQIGEQAYPDKTRTGPAMPGYIFVPALAGGNTVPAIKAAIYIAHNNIFINGFCIDHNIALFILLVKCSLRLSVLQDQIPDL